MNTNSNNKKVIEYSCHKDSLSGLNMDIVDICMVMSIKGKVGGYSNIVSKDDFIDNVFENISESDFKNSQSMTLMASLNPKSDLDIIEKFMNILYTLVPERCETRFGVAFSADMKEGDVGYKILLTGIK